jgi:hypothetical protein
MNQTHPKVRQAHWRPPIVVAAEAAPTTGFLILFSFQRPRAT